MILRQLNSTLLTLFLFTKSDIKTTLVPIVLISTSQFLKECHADSSSVLGDCWRSHCTCLVRQTLCRGIPVDLASSSPIYHFQSDMLIDCSLRGRRQ